MGTGTGVADRTKGFNKAVIPNFLFKPPFGFPVSKNVPEIRRMSKTPFVEMITRTITSEVASMDWTIKTKKGKDIPDEIINKTENFFYNPNSNEESLDFILRSFIRDILELDAGVIEKVHNLKGEFVEMYTRDGGTFTKNPDLHGVLPDENAYYQYGWITGARPIPFDRHELVYAISNPRTETIYGLSAPEVLLDVIQLLTYGVESNLEYFEDNNVPKGVLKMVGASQSDITTFGNMWREALRKKDPSGKWRRYFHKMPVMNTEGSFERVAFSNLELELIQQQQWFTKLVWATFNITPSELGFTESSNRATEVIQSNVFKRKAIAPLVALIEYHFNTEIVNDLPWIKGTVYEGNVLFEFDKYDLQDELAKRELYWGDIKNGLRTPNEIRTEEMDIEEIEGGENLHGSGGNPFSFQDTQNVYEENPAEGTKPPFKAFIPSEKALVTSSSLALRTKEEITPVSVQKKFIKTLDEIETAIKTLLKKELGQNTLSQVKAVDLDFTKKITGIISFENIKSWFSTLIKKTMADATDKVGVEVGMNFVTNQRAVNFIQDYTFSNIKDLQEEMKNDLRAELQRGLINREDWGALSDRVGKVMKSGKNRAEMITKTEINRAQNFGELDAWRQLGKPVTKEWTAVMDSNTSPICRHLNGQVIGINEKFTYKGQEFDSPPSHPRCRSLLRFNVGVKDAGS